MLTVTKYRSHEITLHLITTSYQHHHSTLIRNPSGSWGWGSEERDHLLTPPLLIFLLTSQCSLIFSLCPAAGISLAITVLKVEFGGQCFSISYSSTIMEHYTDMGSSSPSKLILRSRCFWTMWLFLRQIFKFMIIRSFQVMECSNLTKIINLIGCVPAPVSRHLVSWSCG